MPTRHLRRHTLSPPLTQRTQIVLSEQPYFIQKIWQPPINIKFTLQLLQDCIPMLADFILAKDAAWVD